MPAFDHPWLLAALPLALLPAFIRRTPAGLRYNLLAIPAIPRTLRQRLLPLLTFTRILVVVLLICAAAGPHWNAVRMTDETRGIAIELVIDRSGSMSLDDLEYNSKPHARLDVVKAISKEFLLGNGADLKGRSGDAIGLIAFAAHPQSLSPLVSHNETLLAHNIDSIEVAHGDEDATAIGDAIALAASRIRVTEQSRAISFRSKIIILLTDGQENWGTRRLGDAARIAAQWNISIYSVGIRPSPVDTGREDDISYGLDALSSVTNGVAVTANDTDGLRHFFATIDRLEPNTIPASDLNGGFNATLALCLTAFVLIAIEIILRQTWMRTTP